MFLLSVKAQVELIDKKIYIKNGCTIYALHIRRD